MDLLSRPLCRLARRFHMEGHRLILVYIAGIVTASLALAVYEAVRTVG